MTYYTQCASMMQRLRYYLRVYGAHVKVGWKVTMMHRANTFGSLIASVCWSSLIILTVVFATKNVRTVLGYSQSDLIALSAVQVVFLGLFHTLVSHNIEYMPELINTGKLDLVLLKPLDGQLGLTLSRIFPASLIRVVLGAGYLGYLFHSGLMGTFEWAHLFLFCVLIGVSIVLIYSIWVLFATLLIWLPHMDNIVDLLYNLNVISRYPYELFKELGILVILFTYPFSIALVVPMKALMGKVDIAQVGGLIFVTCGLCIASRVFWLFALRHYTSASA